MNKYLASLLVILTVLFFLPSVSSAGFLDKVNAAANKLNQKAQQMQTGSSASQTQAEDPDRPLHLKGQGHCKGQNTATCMDYMEVVDQCMDPIRGYRMKVYGDLIEKKLKTEKNLTDQQRKNLQEDLAGIRAAEKNKTDQPTIAGEKNSQRYLMDISDEDQVYANAEYNQFHQKIYNKCMGADHMGVGHRTEMITDKGMSGEEAVAAMKAKKAKDSEPFECLKNMQGLRFEIMADMMEKKMNSLKVSGKERADWEADIASIRELATAEKPVMPKPVDPNNPARALMRLDQNEQMALNTEYSKVSQEKIAECSNKGPKREQAKLTGTTSQVRAAQKEQARLDLINKKEERKRMPNTATNLNYLDQDGVGNCHDPIKGHMAKVTAEVLEAKFKSANPSGQKRKEWEEDIAAWKEAAEAGADQPDPPDPDNPYRWQDYLTREERQQINMKHAKFANEINAKCNAVDHMGVGKRGK